MRKYIYVGCGSFIGTVLRCWVKEIQIYNYHENIPLNTLFINVSGAFVLAFIMTIALIIWLNSDIRIGITVGLLGAFTTFSALCKETVNLLYYGDYSSAILYLTVSTMLGLGASYFGIVVARAISSKLMEKKERINGIIENESGVK